MFKPVLLFGFVPYINGYIAKYGRYIFRNEFPHVNQFDISYIICHVEKYFKKSLLQSNEQSK